MRRDMDLIREILNTVADASNPVNAQTFVDDTHDLNTIIYHIDLIRQADLAQVAEVKAMGGQIVHADIGPLTWEGNDFLDAVRDDTIWATVKKRIATTVSSVSFDVIKALAVKTATDILL